MKRSASATPLAFLLSHALSFHLEAHTCHQHIHITTPQATADPGKLDAQYDLILPKWNAITNLSRVGNNREHVWFWHSKGLLHDRRWVKLCFL